MSKKKKKEEDKYNEVFSIEIDANSSFNDFLKIVVSADAEEVEISVEEFEEGRKEEE